MLFKISNLSKFAGVKELFSDLSFTVNEGEKVALIGRNGYGKSTLFRILAGEDHDFSGELETRKNLRVVVTQQEHYATSQVKVIEYILQSVPDYQRLQEIITRYESGDHSNVDEYTDAVGVFSDRGYYYLIDLVYESLKDFGIGRELSEGSIGVLSGGQKRFVELVRVMYSQADVALIDEPTNHMDYIGKDQFISWMKQLETSLVVISHDRDVLRHVDRILEIKDKRLHEYKGNYDSYLKQNVQSATNQVIAYQVGLNRLDVAEKRMEWGKRMRAKSKDWKIRYDKWLREYEAVKESVVKPSLWIDQESHQMLDEDVLDSYHKFKEKNITIGVKGSDAPQRSRLLKVANLSLGYGETPLFKNISFIIDGSERIFIKGRNGAGKSTLVKTIVDLWREDIPSAHLFEGDIQLGVLLRIGQYEQETAQRFLEMPLGLAIRSVYEEQGLEIADMHIKRLLAQYLFNPKLDENQIIGTLSGGQRARFQLIKMLSNNPNLLILDEPTNHLDLPSIEELENALKVFEGAILYISHDSYFVKKMGGTQIEIV